MSGPILKAGDGANVALELDPGGGKFTLTYAPATDPLAFTAALKTGTAPLRQALEGLCRDQSSLGNPLTGRAALSSRIVAQRLRHLMEWLLQSKENTNFTYDLTPLNLGHLAAAVSIATARPVADIEAYVREPGEDTALKAHVRERVAALEPRLAALADPVARWSRRLGWYAAVRALKPRFIVETGVDKGLGALMLCAALRRNAAEGRPGRYLGTDINPHAGYLLAGAYAEHGRVAVGDSITTLKTLNDPIDIFINDSDHSAAYEYAEYQAVAPRLHGSSVVMGDNAHVTDMLMRFAAETGRRFLFFREEPAEHWYAGAGIGFAFT